MNTIEPTYFLYSGRLFHEAALPFLSTQLAAHTTPRSENPSPEGPEGEPVGDQDEDTQEDEGDRKQTERKPSPGPGMPIVPPHDAPDANPTDPRVF